MRSRGCEYLGCKASAKPTFLAYSVKFNVICAKIAEYSRWLEEKTKTLAAMNPEQVLRQGYAILKGDIFVDNVVKITTFDKDIKATVKEINERRKDLKQ